MDDALYAPIVSPAEAENFFSSGSDARTIQPNSPAESGLIDVPGVGAVPAHGLPVPDSATSGDRFTLTLSAAEALYLLRRFEPGEEPRDRMLAELIYAARDLAEARIQHVWERTGGKLVTPSWCMECQLNEEHGAIVHAANCKAGRVLNVLTQLIEAAYHSRTLNRKEAVALSPEQPSAGGESRSHGDSLDVDLPIDLLCLACGERGGEWEAERHFSSGVAAKLEPKERLANGWIWSHRCVENGGAR